MFRNPDEEIQNLEEKVRLGDLQAALNLIRLLENRGDLDPEQTQEAIEYPLPFKYKTKTWKGLIIKPYHHSCVTIITTDPVFIDIIAESEWGSPPTTIQQPSKFQIEFNFLTEDLVLRNGSQVLGWYPCYAGHSKELRSTFKFKTVADLSSIIFSSEDLAVSLALKQQPAQEVKELMEIFNVNIQRWVATHSDEMRVADAIWLKNLLINSIEGYKMELAAVKQKERDLAELAIKWIQTKPD